MRVMRCGEWLFDGATRDKPVGLCNGGARYRSLAEKVTQPSRASPDKRARGGARAPLLRWPSIRGKVIRVEASESESRAVNLGHGRAHDFYISRE